MARLTRKNIKVFAENATNNGVFGSLQANNPTTTNDVEQIQSLPAWSNGWDDATMTSEELPPLEEFQGVQYVVSYEQAYLMQEGLPEWSTSVTYFKGSLVKNITPTGFQIYNSLTDNNTGNLLSDTSNWKLVMDSDNLYAFDNAVVHKAGTETITGTKTFASEIISKEGGTYANYASGTQSYMGINAHDSTGLLMGMVDCWTGTDGTTETRIVSHNPNNSNIYSLISARVDANGNVSTNAPTPASNSNDNNIATTAWVNTVGNNVVHRSGNENISGTKTFTGNVRLPFGTLLTKQGVAISGGTLQFEQPTDTSLKGIASIDIYGNLMRFIGVNSSQNYTVPLRLDLETNTTLSTPSSAIDSVVTTTGISKSENGFVRLGNGLIIQWGICSSGVQTNFPTPFTSVVKMCLSGTGQYGTTSSSIYSLTKTYFEARNSSGWSMNFIAIGY